MLSHLGRPKGTISADTSLRPVARKMQELMPGTTVRFIGDCMGEEVRRGLGRAQARRCRRARECSLLSRRGEERPPLCQEPRRARRSLCRRRLLIGAPRACLGRRHRRPASLLCGPVDDGRDHRARRSAGKSGTAGDGHCRRRQGLHQDRRPDQSRRAHGRSRRRRRHGQHLPARQGRGYRRLLLRAGFRADRQGHHGARQTGRLRDRPADRRGGRQRAESRASPGASARWAPCRRAR